MAIGPYCIIECIHDAGWYRLYRAGCQLRRREVVLKYLADNHPSPTMLASFHAEYRILRQLDMPAVIKALALEEHGRRLILVREYLPGSSLYDHAAGQALALQVVCQWVLLLAETLDAIHSRGIIHGNLNPQNVLVDAESKQLKLIGFSRAKYGSQLDNEFGRTKLPLRGTDYLALEQSGRMNRRVDARADIYASGVTFFELLTGRTPFSSSDAIGLIHRHIAQNIPDPREFCPQLPAGVARVVIRMLAKDPDQRYATAAELLSDMQILERQLSNGEMFDEAVLKGQVQANFMISERLYGREAELGQLAAALERSQCGRAVLCLVAGRSGVGKSRLFEAFSREILPDDAYFITAKCDQYQLNPPAQIFRTAFKDLLQRLLGEDEQTLAMWRGRLQTQLGEFAQPIAEMLPELDMLLGPQPALPELPAAEARNRLLRVWVRFVQIFCEPGRPLCLFVDDLQWADPALFAWLEPMLFEVKHLLLIVSYRDNEIDRDAGLSGMTGKLRSDGGPVETVELGALPLSALSAMLADSMTLDDASLAELCHALHAKTQGNPFFFIQYLRELQQDGCLSYQASGKWGYDKDRIDAVGFSDNVVEFMLMRMEALDQPVRELLKFAACLGMAFDNGLLGAVFGDHSALHEHLAIAEAWGLLVKRPGDKTGYAFSHDRVQQAAHSLLTDDEWLGYRLKIGRYWAEEARDKHDRPLLFQAVEHLNAAQTLIVEIGERRALGADNFRLGLWAKHGGAFEQALPYLRQASELLGDELASFGGWAAVLRQRAECEHLCGHHPVAEQFFEKAVSHADSDLEKARIFELMIQFYADLSQFDKAYRVSRQAAALFGIDLPSSFNRLSFAADLLALKYRLRRFAVHELLSLPTVADTRMDIAIRLLSASLKVAYQIRPELCVAIAVKQVSRCLQYGNTAEAVIGYMVFGVIFLGGVLGDHQAGYDYGRLSLGLLDKYANQRQRAEVNFVYGYFAHSWTFPAADTETYWRTALASGLETGDWFHSGCACCGLAQSGFMRGVPLDQLWQDTGELVTTLTRIDSREHLGVILGIRQAIENLRGNTLAPDSFSDADFDETVFAENLAGHGSRHFAHYYFINKMQSLYLWGEYERALAFSRLSAGYLKDSAGMLHMVEHHFYTALIVAALYAGMSRFERYRALRTMRRTEKKLCRWARRCPQNFLSRRYLLAGEIQRLRRRPALALLAYQHAATEAESTGQLHLEALANELAAQQQAALGQERLARFHLDEAAYCYRRWGATAHWQRVKAGQEQTTPKAEESLTSQASAFAFDTITLIKAAEAIASERRLPQLLQTLMHIVIENAGAQRGVLLLREEDELMLQAEAEIDAERVEVMQRLPFSAATGLPQSVINFVSRSQETVVLENALDNPIYGRDKDIAARHVRSLLCAPLLLRGELQGVLYLENNAVDAVFTGERVFLLRHLSGQIAISIDNALGYQLLEDKVAERTAHIESQKGALEEKNSELEVRNTVISGLNARLQSENWERRLAEKELQKANEELQRLVMIDGLTQIGNRRRFDESLEIESQRVLREQIPLALVLCDIDYFKRYNDLYGHQAGDECLKKVAQAIAGSLRRTTDLAARYGGEEFAVILPYTDMLGATRIADTIRQAVTDLQIPHQGSLVAESITVSIGIACATPPQSCMPAALIKTADDALYQVKENGRNGIVQKAVA